MQHVTGCSSRSRSWWRLAVWPVVVFSALTAARPAGAQESLVTDEKVEDAVKRATAWLLSKRSADGSWESGGATGGQHWAGETALVLLSLLYAGQDPREQTLSQSLDWLASQTLNGTYAYGARAHALALAGTKYKSRLQQDLNWLLKAVWPRGSDHPGGYDYTPPASGMTAGRWDNSATQFGVLGVWMAADAGLPVPDDYWEIVGQHFITFQNKDGGWGYQANQDSTGSMTAAGLASLFVVLDQRYADHPKDAGALLGAIEGGLNWFGREYGPENKNGDGRWQHYYLYGVERVGRASGRKYFRDKDWFREGAADLLRRQKANGTWDGGSGEMNDEVNTALALMFLCHGRAPLLFNKLEHGPDWNNRMRDVAGFVRYTGRALERLLNWQIVRLDGSLDDLMEAPVLYLRGEGALEFTDPQVQKLREYCQRGGLLLAVAGNNSDAFRNSLEEFARRAFSEYTLRPLPNEHPLFNGEVQFPIADPPLVMEVNNGVRVLFLLVTKDIADSWNKYAVKGPGEKDFQLACNIYLYATDKAPVRSRLQTPNIADRNTKAERTVKVARIKYNGKWDLEPYGWTRLRHYLKNETGTNLLVTSGVTFDSPGLKDYPVAHITGTEAFELTPEEQRGLRQFLAGGTLLADAAGGSPEFTKSLEKYVKEAQKSDPHALPPDSFVLTGAGIPGGVDLGGTVFRRAARSAGRGQQYPRLRTFASRRQLSVIYSPLDLSTGLLGTQVYNVQGYDPDSTLKIMRNLVLYAQLSAAEKAQLQRGK